MTQRSKEGRPAVAVLKSTGPKLVPFFKTLAIYFVLYGDGAKPDSVIYCIFKCLPILSLMIFVLLHGMSFADCYSYSRKILIGLIFSCIGDALLVCKSDDHFLLGLIMFAVAQVIYTTAFGFRPLCPRIGLFLLAVAILIFWILYPGLGGIMTYCTSLYIALLGTMGWRAMARVQFVDDLWTWTKMCCCVGSICFIISDCIIAFNKFRSSTIYAHQTIMVTYYAAQFLITVSVVDSQTDALLLKNK